MRYPLPFISLKGAAAGCSNHSRGTPKPYPGIPKMLPATFAVVGVLCVSFCSEASPTTTKVQFFFRLWFVDAESSIQKLPDRN